MTHEPMIAADGELLELLALIAAEERELYRLREQLRASEAKARDDRQALKACEKRREALLRETITDRPLFSRPAESIPVAAAPPPGQLEYWSQARIETLELEDETIAVLDRHGVRTVVQLIGAATNDLPYCDRDQAVDVDNALQAFRRQLDPRSRVLFDACVDGAHEERALRLSMLEAANRTQATDPETPPEPPESPETAPDPYRLPKCPDCGGDHDKPNRGRKPHSKIACHIGLDGKARRMRQTPEEVRAKRENPSEIQNDLETLEQLLERESEADAEERDELEDEWTPEVRALLDDPAVNGLGVYTTYETIAIPGIPKNTKCAAEVRVAQGNDGYWRFGYSVQSSNGHGSCLPRIDYKGYRTRSAAIRSVCEYFTDRFGSQPKAQAAVAAFVETLEPEPEPEAKPVPLVPDWESIGVHDLELSDAAASVFERLGLTTAGALDEWLKQVDADEDDGSTVHGSLSWVYRESAKRSLRQALEGIRQPVTRIGTFEQEARWKEEAAALAPTPDDDMEPIADWGTVPVADLGMPGMTAETLNALGVTTAGELARWLERAERLGDVANNESAYGLDGFNFRLIVGHSRHVLEAIRPESDPQPPAPKERKPKRRKPEEVLRG